MNEQMYFVQNHMFLKVKNVRHIINQGECIKRTTNHILIIVETGTLIINQQQFMSNTMIHIERGSYVDITAFTQTSYYLIQYIRKMVSSLSSVQPHQELPLYSQSIIVGQCNNTPLLFDLLQQIRVAYESNHSVKVKYVMEQIYREFLDSVLQKHNRLALTTQYEMYLKQSYSDQKKMKHIHQQIHFPQEVLKKTNIAQLSLTQYVKELRIQVAQYYLMQPQYKIKDVIAYLNIDNDFTFTAWFKAWTRMSPQYFKENSSRLAEKSIINENEFHYTNNQFARIIVEESEQKKYMKKYMQISFLVSVMVLLVACNNNDKTESQEIKEEDVETRLFTDATGRKVEIPVAPKRIVTDQYVEALLALDVKPIGASKHVLNSSYLKDQIDGIKDIGTPLSIESVLELKPDLIITMREPGEPELEKLEKIAPTVVVPFGEGVDVYGQLKYIAEIVHKEQVAEEWIARLEEKAQAVKIEMNQLIKPEETVTLMMTYGKEQPRIYGGRNIGHLFYRLLDLKPIPYIEDKIKEDPNFGEFVNDEVSLETLTDYMGDWVFLIDYVDEGPDNSKTYEEIVNSPLWKNVDAVKNNHVIALPEDPYFTYAPIAIEKSLDQIIDDLQKYHKE